MRKTTLLTQISDTKCADKEKKDCIAAFALSKKQKKTLSHTLKAWMKSYVNKLLFNYIEAVTQSACGRTFI